MRAALFLAIAMLTACASITETPPPQRLTDADLTDAADALRQGTSTIYYKVYRYHAGTGQYVHSTGGRFDGFLTSRNLVRLTALPDGNNTDGRFNRILFDLFENEKGEARVLSLTATSDGTAIASLEADVATGRVAAVAVFRDRDFFAVLGDFEGLRALPCLDAAARRGSLLDLMRCFELPSGGGDDPFAGGFAEDANHLLGEPDCERDMLGPVSFQNDRRTPQEWRRRADQARGAARERRRANPRPSDRYNRLTEAYEDLADAQDAAADAKEEFDRVMSDPTATTAERTQASTDFKRALIRERKAMRTLIREFNAQLDNSDSNTPADVTGLEAPSGIKDPRCAGRETDSERGTLFTNPEYCGDDDLLTCLLREQNSLFGFTEGQCWTETGPDDNLKIVCGEAERFPGRAGQLSPDDLPDPGQCPPDDLDCWTDPVAPMTSGGNIATRYIDLTPLGALLAGICAKVGCPGETP